MRLYVNGALEGETDVPGGLENVAVSSPSFSLGRARYEESDPTTGEPEAFMRGGLDEAAYYPQALSASRVQAHYEAAFSDPQPPSSGPDSPYRRHIRDARPFVWFPFDEHYVEPTDAHACSPCPAYEAISGSSSGEYMGLFREVTGPTEIGANDHGLDFRSGGSFILDGAKTPLSGASSFGIDVWVKTGPDTPAQQAFLYRPTCGGCNGYMALRLNGERLEVRSDGDTVDAGWQSLGGSNLNDRHWHHLQINRDYPRRVWRADIDGASTGTEVAVGNTSVPSTSNYFHAGEVNYTVGDPAGEIAVDELAYFTYVLNAEAELLEAHKPMLSFTPDENFPDQQAEALTNHFRLDSNGAYQPGEATALQTTEAGQPPVLATAGAPLGTVVDNHEVASLSLETLGPTYPFSVTFPSLGPLRLASGNDYLDAPGSSLEGYLADSGYERETWGRDHKVYGRVAIGASGRKWLQYWFFYYFNDYNNLVDDLHEGDWEMIQVRLDSNDQPDRITYARHNYGVHCDWGPGRTVDGVRPRVFVAQGSHASYGTPGQTPIHLQFPLHAEDDHWGGSELGGIDVIPPVEVIRGSLPWLSWPGHWGSSLDGNFPSPGSPATQPQWDPDAYDADASDCE